MKILHFFIFILFIVCVNTFGQPGKDSSAANKTNHKFRSFHKNLHARTKEQINELKAGALLVRLQTKKLTLNALRQRGLHKQADKIKSDQKDFNIKVIAAFKAEFNFCPTYFFYSDQSDMIIKKQFDKVDFLTDGLRVDTTIKFNKGHFLVAKFGIIEPDTSKTISGGEHMGFGALLIESDQFVQLKRPFPYYVRTLDLLPMKRSPTQVVRKMNKKLAKFYRVNRP